MFDAMEVDMMILMDFPCHYRSFMWVLDCGGDLGVIKLILPSMLFSELCCCYYSLNNVSIIGERRDKLCGPDKGAAT